MNRARRHQTQQDLPDLRAPSERQPRMEMFRLGLRLGHETITDRAGSPLIFRFISYSHALLACGLSKVSAHAKYFRDGFNSARALRVERYHMENKNGDCD